jgi:hypothetical protein
MAKELTVRAIETLRKPAKRREIPDGKLRGLFLIQQPTGRMSWAVRFRNRSRQTKKLTIGSYPVIDLKNARALARKALVAVAEGIDVATVKRGEKETLVHAREGEDVGSVVAAYIEKYAKPRTKTWRQAQLILHKHAATPWAGRHIGDITRTDILAVTDALMDRGKAVAANRTLAYIRRLFDWAAQRGMIADNPCRGIRPPGREQDRDRVLSDVELAQLWRACDDLGGPFSLIVKLLILTGQRRTEVSDMVWHEIDLGGRTWVMPPGARTATNMSCR